MTEARLQPRIEVTALIRRAESRGGTGMVLAKGQPEAGSILLLLSERGTAKSLLERHFHVSGSYRWSRVGPQDIESYQLVNDYIERRRRSDTDLWVVELDVAGVQRFAEELMTTG